MNVGSKEGIAVQGASEGKRLGGSTFEQDEQRDSDACKQTFGSMVALWTKRDSK